MGKHYLPWKEGELALWSERFMEELEVNADLWEIPHKEINDLKIIVQEFNHYFKIIDSPLRTKIDIVKKNVAKTEMLRQIRLMVNFRLRNPVITNDQRIALGLFIRRPKGTPIPPPQKSPAIYLRIVNSRQITAEIRDPYASKRIKPYGITNIRLSYSIGEQAPNNPEYFQHHLLATKTLQHITFTEEDRGKKLFLAAQWQNKKGQTGPWSDIICTIIP
ncbi:MAG: hypothetical protein LBI60_02495 [Bacteroidales bacterium]|jgi:hypothetical protein|nr:hypothetical protein [Bacteroidales bacterium]